MGRLTLAILCGAPAALSPHAALLEELGPELDQLIVAAQTLEPGLLGAAPRLARLVASLHQGAGLPGALQSALLACSGSTLIALDAALTTPASSTLRRLWLDPRPGNTLVYRHAGALRPLPGRFRRGCLGPLSRALLEGATALGPLLRRLRCSTLDD